MLPKCYRNIGEGSTLNICRFADGCDASRRGAFPLDTELEFRLSLSRRLGVTAVALRLSPDGGEAKDYPLSFYTTSGDTDEYTVTINLTAAFCGGEDGLFYYDFLIFRGKEIFFSDTWNNVDSLLVAQEGRKFRLLVYKKDFHTPSWFSGGIMYHVFVDRFCRGKGEVGTRADAFLNPDWENGVPPYPEKPGDPLDNNVFFGGNLWGIAEKLDYLSSLGVTVLYLSPIFKAYSNHKYDTGDYETIDEMFGGEAAFSHLLTRAKERGIRIILDGVFNHTGDDSRYFNRYGKYAGVGAYQSLDSKYHDWFCFRDFPNSYESWWGIPILPKLNPTCDDCRQYLAGREGIVSKYIEMGIGGWRIDVADELSDEFLDLMRESVKEKSGGEGIIIGEVWENAADKIAYGKRRRYFRGNQLDSVMNYPVKNAILGFVLAGDGDGFYNTLTELYSSYPSEVCDSLMNLLGTHDTERILSVLGGAPLGELSNRELAQYRLSGAMRERAIRRLKLASILQFTVFGVPSVYYGDEAGSEGGHDPFCRMPFPWGRECTELVEHYRMLGRIRRDNTLFAHGEMKFVSHMKHFVAYERASEDESILVLANSGEAEHIVILDKPMYSLIDGRRYHSVVRIAPESADILKEDESC